MLEHQIVRLQGQDSPNIIQVSQIKINFNEQFNNYTK